jgi:uncharacterized protein YecA (UPF0149 family)
MPIPRTGEDEIGLSHVSIAPQGSEAVAPETACHLNDPLSWSKAGRNEDCPCCSGKQYKHCQCGHA